MKKKFTNMESRGLPGGPNEMFTYTTGVFSTEGYRDDSPDRHNLFNIINSSDISMEGVGGPVLGIDTFGNKQMMYPGGEYKFQGDKVFEIPMFEHGGPHDPDDPPSKIITTDQHLAELKAAYEAEAARAREVMENAHALGLKLATNEENQDTQLQVAKGFRTQVTDDGYDLAPREILISNAQDWEEIGMGFINDPKHWINNLITKDPMTGKTMYVQRPSSIRTDEYGNRKWVNVRDEDGNLIPRRKRGQGCIGAMCGIFSTAGATQVEDYSTGTGKTTKAGDPIFKQMSNAFWDANNEAALRAAGFEKVKEGDPITEGTLARNRNIDAKGNPYHSHTAMVNVVNEDGTAVDFTDLQGFIENPGGLSMGITTSKPYKGYDLEYYNYVGKSPALKKEYEDFLAKVEELRGFDDIERLPLVKSELSKRETSSGIPKIIRREESDKPKRNKFFANKRIKRHGGPHDPLSPEYLKSEGFANAVNQDLDSLLKGWNTDGYDSHWYKGNAESYGVTADQLREFAAKNHPKSFVNAAAYTQAMNKLANDAGAPNVSNIPFAYNPMVMRTADDDIEYVEYEKPTTLQEEGYIDETGTKAVNLDKDYKTGLAKRYGRNRYDHLVEEKDGGSTLELGNIDPKSRYGQWIKRKVDSGKYIYDSEKDELILKKLHEGGEPGHTHRKKHAWRDVQPSESNPEYKKDMYTAYLDGDITKKEYEDHLLKEQIKAYYGESKPSEKEIKRLQHPMNLSTPRKLQFGEPGFKEQQERNRGDAAGLVEDFGKGVAHTADEFFVQPVVRTYDKVTTDPLQFAKDIGNTFIDAATYPQELLYEGADSLFGFDDGSFNMEGKANLLGNPYGSGVGTTLDAALTIPIVKGTTSLISPAFKTARRELMYHGVNPVDYKPFKKILRMPRTLLENAIDPAGRPARLFGANKMKDPRHVENVTRMGERRLDAWAEYLGKNQKYNTFDKFADGRYALKDEFAINPKGRGFKHNRTVNNNLVQNELVADAYTQQADDLLKAGTINEAQHEKLLQEIYDVSIQDGSKSRITISNAFKNKLYKDMPEKANITREPLKSYERKRIVQPSTSKEYDYTIYDWDYSGVRGGMSYNVKLPEKNLITDFLKKNNLKGGVQTTEGLPGGPNQYKSNNFIIESHDTWDLMPFTRRNPRVYVNDPVQSLKPRLLDDFEIGPLIGGKPLNITNRQVFDRNLRLLNEAKPFKSEINWAKWNKDIPKNKPLMDEYLAIEENTKASGTWMKNPDGSAFKGTPEQFVQQQSQNFKNAFPEGAGITHRGTWQNNTNLKQGLFTSKEKEFAAEYAPLSNQKIIKSADTKGGGINKLYYPKSKKSADIDLRNQDWAGIELNKIKSGKDWARHLEVNIEGQNKQLATRRKQLDALTKKIKETGNPNVIGPRFWTKKELIESINSIKNRIEYLKTQQNLPPIESSKVLEQLKKAFPGETSTDDILDYMIKNDIDNVKLRNIIDDGMGTEILINNRPGNRVKSAVGNDGMFDMTNPDIYKALLPFIFGTALSNQKYGGSIEAAPPKLQGGGWLSNFIRKHTPSFDFTYGRRGMQDPTMGPNLRFGSIYGDTRDSGNYLDLGLNLGYAVNANLDPYRSNFPLTGGVDATYVGPKMGRAFRAAVTGGVDWSPYMGTTAYFGFAPQFEAGKKLDEKLRRPAGRNVFKKFFDPRSYSLQTRPLGFFGGMRARSQNIGIEGNPPPTVSGELVGDPFTNAYTWTPFDYYQAIAQQPDFNAWEAITEDGGSGIGGPMWGFMGDLSFRKRLGDNLSAILRAGYTADFIKGKAQEEWGNQSFMGPDGVTAYTQGSSGDDKVKLAFDPRFQIGLTYTPDHRRYRGRSKQIRDRKIREDKIIQDVIEKNSSVEEETEPKTMSRHPRWLKDGGQHLDGYKIYKDFVNGAYDNTDDYVSAEAIYDKLNRIHYEDAKNANMSPANYIMTNIINA